MSHNDLSTNRAEGERRSTGVAVLDFLAVTFLLGLDHLVEIVEQLVFAGSFFGRSDEHLWQGLPCFTHCTAEKLDIALHDARF